MTSHTRGPRWWAHPCVGLAELRRRQGRPERPRDCSRRPVESPAAQLCRAPHRSRPRRDAGRSRARWSGCCDSSRRSAGSTALRPSSFSPGPQSGAGSSTRRGTPGEFREVAAAGRAPALSAAQTRPRGMLSAAAGDHERARPLLEDSLDRFERSGAPFDTARTRIELPPPWPLWAVPPRPPRSRPRSSCLHELGAAALVTRARALHPTGRGSESPLADLTRARARGAGPARRALTNRQIAEPLVLRSTRSTAT